ncbi:MAG: Mov34/MPN/PAD-1 family protein [Sediminibacterium sp.]|nr:Mov34/MPN/PAD-1 family protein [Sediminibacterium sp.]MDP3129202.1 Mov34/MPN/PAD-1 family protein [Sediminibacterium sp.]
MSTLYSTSYQPYSGNLPLPLKEAIEEICRYFKVSEVPVLLGDKYHIVVPVILKVAIPSRGSVGGIDIKESEPLLIQMSINHYPLIAPFILSDRIDFPVPHLSHLYATAAGEPARICLVRGNPHEWFGNKRMADLLWATEEWFYKAATGKLDTDGNEFDPVRLINYTGYHVYQYETMRDIVNAAVPFLPDYPLAGLFSVASEDSKDKGNSSTFTTQKVLTAYEMTEAVKLMGRTEIVNESRVNRNLLSIVVWHPENLANDLYQTGYPRNYKGLKEYFDSAKIPIDEILQFLVNKRWLGTEMMPIIHAVRRSKKIVGFNGEYDFFNLAIIPALLKGKIQDRSIVTLHSHIEPFSSSLANKISGEMHDTNTIYIGAGSLGSKMVMHDARSGNLNMGVCDEKPLLAHNMVRHALYSSHIGQNKAEAIVAELKKMYTTDLKRNFIAYPDAAHFLSDPLLAPYELLVDTTASINTQNWLVQKKFSKEITIARGELVDQGRVGLFYIEGKNRNPRLDDLVNLAYFRSVVNKDLEQWRKEDVKRNIDTLDIGMGCSSNTVVMPDDIISFHAANFSRTLNLANVSGSTKGLFYVSCGKLLPGSEIKDTSEWVLPFDCFNCLLDSGWELRFIGGLSQRLISISNLHAPRETGGVLIGMISHKTKSIHVFDILEAPVDSKATSSSFTRGTQGLKETVNDFLERSGNMIQYIGEWHTHPMNLESPSAQDINTVSELFPKNEDIGIPTISVIVTKEKILPYVFS